MLKEATGSLKRFAAPGGMEGLTGPLGIVQVRGNHFSAAAGGSHITRINQSTNHRNAITNPFLRPPHPNNTNRWARTWRRWTS